MATSNPAGDYDQMPSTAQFVPPPETGSTEFDYGANAPDITVLTDGMKPFEIDAPVGGPRRLADQLAELMHRCRYVQKDAVNQFHKYRYASAEAVLGKFNDALYEVGLAIIGTKAELLHFVPIEDQGKQSMCAVVRMTITIGNGYEEADYEGLGQGSDRGDKAVMKADTAAAKYAIAGACCISWGDDPEADESTDKLANAPFDWEEFIHRAELLGQRSRVARDLEHLKTVCSDCVQRQKPTEEIKGRLRTIITSTQKRLREESLENGAA